jgi:hypothetical protein
MPEPQTVIVQGLWATNVLLGVIVLLLVLILIKIGRRSGRPE